MTATSSAQRVSGGLAIKSKIQNRKFKIQESKI